MQKVNFVHGSKKNRPLSEPAFFYFLLLHFYLINNIFFTAEKDCAATPSSSGIPCALR